MLNETAKPDVQRPANENAPTSKPIGFIFTRGNDRASFAQERAVCSDRFRNLQTGESFGRNEIRERLDSAIAEKDGVAAETGQTPDSDRVGNHSLVRYTAEKSALSGDLARDNIGLRDWTSNLNKSFYAAPQKPAYDLPTGPRKVIPADAVGLSQAFQIDLPLFAGCLHIGILAALGIHPKAVGELFQSAGDPKTKIAGRR